MMKGPSDILMFTSWRKVTGGSTRYLKTFGASRRSGCILRTSTLPSPLPADSRVADLLVELRLGAAGGLAGQFALLVEDVLADLRANESGDVGIGERIEADQVRVVGRRQGDRGVQPGVHMGAVVDVDEQVFERHRRGSSWTRCRCGGGRYCGKHYL